MKFEDPLKSSDFDHLIRESNPNEIFLPTDDDIMKLAEMNGMQFVRATDDGQFEVMSNKDAKNLISQNSAEVEIIDSHDEASMFNDILNMQNYEARRPYMIFDPNDESKALTMEDFEMLQEREKILMESKSFEEMQWINNYYSSKYFEHMDSSVLPVGGVPIDNSEFYIFTNLNLLYIV